MIRAAFSLCLGALFCFAGPLLAGMLLMTARTPDVRAVIMLIAAAMSGIGMMWIFGEGQSAALRRFLAGRRSERP